MMTFNGLIFYLYYKDETPNLIREYIQ